MITSMIANALQTLYVTKFDRYDSAENNLRSKTHYADKDTMKYFKAKISCSHVTDNGLLLGMIEHLPVGGFDAPKMYRPVVFDVFGTVLNEREAFKTKAQALKALWIELDKIDAEAHTIEALKAKAKRMADDAKRLADVLGA